MSYVIQAVLSNPRRPECDQITIPFPIPVDQYDKTIEMLQAIDLGFSVNRDCTVDEVNSRYSVLNTLVGTLVNIDQLDYLAKRLDGFCAGEVSQFQAMAHKLGLSVQLIDIDQRTHQGVQHVVPAVHFIHSAVPIRGKAQVNCLEHLNGLIVLVNGNGERDRDLIAFRTSRVAQNRLAGFSSAKSQYLF